MAKRKKQIEIDASLTGHGSIWLLSPHTQAAKDWIRDNVGGDTQWIGNRLAVETRYVASIFRGLTDAGLSVFVAT